MGRTNSAHPGINPRSLKKYITLKSGKRTKPNFRNIVTRERIEIVLFYIVLCGLWIISEIFCFWECATRLFLVVFFIWAVDSYRMWKKYFSHRKNRWEEGCPSFSRRPRIGIKKQKDWKTACPMTEMAKSALDMDHIYLPFIDYLWGKVFVTLPYTLSYLFGGFNSYGYIWIRFRYFLQSYGIVNPVKIRDPAKAFATTILETALAIYYTGPLEFCEDGRVLAPFTIPDCAHLNRDGDVEFHDLHAVVDVKNREALRVEFDGEEIAIADGFMLLTMAQVSQLHPQIHAYSNWAVSTEHENPWIRRMSIVTVVYNNMGHKGVWELLDMLFSVGLLKWLKGCTMAGTVETEPRATKPGVLARVQQGVKKHSNIRDLVPFSEYVDFIVQTRAFFRAEFKKYDDDFPGVDPECLFLGTVLHSTDHEQCYLANGFEFNHVDARFEPNEEPCRTWLGMGDGPWFLSFETTFKDAPHPLFRDTYEFARHINEHLAGCMQACIAR